MSDDQTPVPEAKDTSRGHDRGQGRESQAYQIRIRAHLDDSWSAWFEGLRVTPEADGTTLLEGPVIDQPALHGLLARIRDLGLPLIAVTCIRSAAKRPPPPATSFSTDLDATRPTRNLAPADQEQGQSVLCPGQASRLSAARNDSVRYGGYER